MCDHEYPFFSHDELKCKGSGECKMNNRFMTKLVSLRRLYDKPMIITKLKGLKALLMLKVRL